MLLPPRTAAALVAAGALLGLPAAAPAAEPVLLAQIDEAATTAQLPPLSDDPPIEEPDEPEPQPEPEPEPEPEEPEPEPDEPENEPAKPALPDTGAEAWLVALLGTGMVLSGGGLRLTLADGRGRRR